MTSTKESTFVCLSCCSVQIMDRLLEGFQRLSVGELAKKDPIAGNLSSIESSFGVMAGPDPGPGPGSGSWKCFWSFLVVTMRAQSHPGTCKCCQSCASISASSIEALRLLSTSWTASEKITLKWDTEPLEVSFNYIDPTDVGLDPWSFPSRGHGVKREDGCQWVFSPEARSLWKLISICHWMLSTSCRLNNVWMSSVHLEEQPVWKMKRNENYQPQAAQVFSMFKQCNIATWAVVSPPNTKRGRDPPWMESGLE